MVQEGLHRLHHQGIALDGLDLLLIENVGNLVCPAAYDLGEDLRLVLLAVGEGEDKPLKYAPSFHSADLVVITKTDLAEAVGFDGDAARAAIARVAPQARILATSARSGDGRLFSSYSTAGHGQLWIITDDIRGEGEGPITTVMFPDDY